MIFRLFIFTMEKPSGFLNKYGIVIHVLSIILWLYIIWSNYERWQDGTANRPVKISFYISFALLGLSVFNLITAIRRRNANK